MSHGTARVFGDVAGGAGRLARELVTCVHPIEDRLLLLEPRVPTHRGTVILCQRCGSLRMSDEHAVWQRPKLLLGLSRALLKPAPSGRPRR